MIVQLTSAAVDAARTQLEFYWARKTGSFLTSLFDAILSADPINKMRLMKAFPAEVYAFLEAAGELSLCRAFGVEVVVQPPEEGEKS